MKLTVPICDAAGQPAPEKSAAVQACRTLATPGESVVPTGSTISARLTGESPGWRFRVTFAPLGTARRVVSSVGVTDGRNGTPPQPVGVNVADCVVPSASIVIVAGPHDVGIVMNAASSVRSSAATPKPPSSRSAIVESSPPSGRNAADAWLRTASSGSGGTGITSMPSRAGSFGPGARLYTLPLPGSGRTGAPAPAPPFAPPGQPPLSNVATGQRANLLGFPTRPGGKCSTTRDGVCAKSAW